MVSIIDEAVDLVTTVCRLPGNDRVRRRKPIEDAKAAGVAGPSKARDTPALYRLADDGFSYPGHLRPDRC